MMVRNLILSDIVAMICHIGWVATVDVDVLWEWILTDCPCYCGDLSMVLWLSLVGIVSLNISYLHWPGPWRYRGLRRCMAIFLDSFRMHVLDTHETLC